MNTFHSGRLALGGITAALTVMTMLLTAVVPFGDLALPAIAGALLIPITIEMGKKAGLTVFGAAGLLVLLLVGVWETKLLYVGFFGYYPLLKGLLEGRCHRVVEWIVKLAVFNGAAVGIYALLFAFFSLPRDTFSIAGVSLPLVFLAAGNLIFLLYDIGLTRVISLYIRQWSPRVRRLFHFS